MKLSAYLKGSVKYLWRKTGAYKLPAAKAGAFVLSFHRVKPQDGSLIDARLGEISPQGLRQILQMVKDLGFKFVTTDEFREIGSKQAKSACLTFDDGLRDLLDFALPVLREQRVPATVFLITSTAHRQDLLWQHRLYEAMDRLSMEECLRYLPRLTQEPLQISGKASLAGYLLRELNKAELLEISHVFARAAGITTSDERTLARSLYLREEEVPLIERDGIALGGHSSEHWPAVKLSEAELEADYRACRADLGRWSNRSRFDFCIPFGDLSNNCSRIAAQAGFTDVYVSDRFKSPAGPSIPRVWPSGNLNDFAFLMSRRFHERAATESPY